MNTQIISTRLKFYGFALITIFALWAGKQMYLAAEGNNAVAALPQGQASQMRAMSLSPFLPELSTQRKVMANNDLILKLSQAELKDILDQPELIRHEGPFNIWQYRTESCVLDIYYKQDEHRGANAIHYETRARDQKSRRAGDCVNTFVAQNTPLLASLAGL